MSINKGEFGNREQSWEYRPLGGESREGGAVPQDEVGQCKVIGGIVEIPSVTPPPPFNSLKSKFRLLF